QDGVVEILREGVVDYIGFSYYMSTVVKHDTQTGVSNNIINSGLTNSVENLHIKISEWGWAIDPEWQLYTHNVIYERYQVPSFIVENVFGAIDKVENNQIHDDYRINYLSEHIEAMIDSFDKVGGDLIVYTWLLYTYYAADDPLRLVLGVGRILSSIHLLSCSAILYFCYI
ncbi:hypothetical protein DV965_16180, partial [Staphylococcus pseudintermedius]